jgi:Glycosyl hydrolase family 63 C-terminal domain
MYSLNLMRIALELAEHDHVYEDIASKFFEHFLNIAEAMSCMYSADVGLWDEEDQFFYDVLNLPNDARVRLRIRSMVGLIPLFAVETLEPELLERLPGFRKRLEWFLNHRPDLANLVSHWQSPGRGERRLLSLLRGHRMEKLLQRMLDESEFLSDYGVRALSRAHLAHPYVFKVDHTDLSVRYAPAESESRQFGGNSNWRGPIWFPMNFLIIESLQKFHHYYGNDFKVECPTGSGHYVTIDEVATELSHRLARIFLKDANGERAVLRHQPQLQTDPNYQDCIPFYEYFHGDTGRGVGASHQSGWTSLIAKLLMPRAHG